MESSRSFNRFMFFLYSSRDRGSLPSFPTRRSSDLSSGGGSGTRGARATVRASSRRKRLFVSLRSEEHTSELQSRLHLVCRLLLEKKKDLRMNLRILQITFFFRLEASGEPPHHHVRR